jgi:hypothetical protein
MPTPFPVMKMVQNQLFMIVIHADPPPRRNDPLPMMKGGTKPAIVIHDEDGTNPGMVVTHDDALPHDERWYKTSHVVMIHDKDGTNPGMVVIHDDLPLHDEHSTKPPVCM